MLPNRPERFSFPPAGTALNPGDSSFPDSAWFKVDVRDQADSGLKQQLRFFIQNAMENAPWNRPTLEILDAGTSAVLTDIAGDPLIGPTAQIIDNRVVEAVDGTTKQNGSFLIRVTRAHMTDSLQLLAGWQTNLSLLGGVAVGAVPTELVCSDETNPEWGSDEIALEVNVDGMGWQQRGSRDFDCNEKDEHWPWDAELGVIRFLESVEMRLVEADDGDDDVSPVKTLTLAKDIDLVAQPERRDERMFEWDGGEYHFNFFLDKCTRR